MALCNSPISQSLKSPKPIFNLPLLLFITISLLPCAKPIFFNFTTFTTSSPNLNYTGDAVVSGGAIQLTKNQLDGSIQRSVGRATYPLPIPLWDNKTQTISDFTTHFSFMINALNSTLYGDGLAFFLAPFGSSIPPNSYGGSLGLFDGNTTKASPENPTVAVEFDTFKNYFDPSSDHVGIDVNSIVSMVNVTWPSSIKDGRTANAWVSYNGSTKILSVFLTYADNPMFNGNWSLSYYVDLMSVLPQNIEIGFSAATGSFTEIHKIISWDFNSSLVLGGKGGGGFVAGLVVFVGVLLNLCGLAWVVLRRKKILKTEEDKVFDEALNEDFERGTGPKRFSYKELVSATGNFSEEGKLGQGGFGGVYKGVLKDPSLTVAVKKISQGSRQGKKEYVSEVKIISRVRHRNLVQLIGWCHDRGEFQLVYEYMPNGSLDSHLFGKRDPLTWVVRYKIALGLASALLYLHEEWEQCVVHRDIKSSNVMLDSGFNAKLGDFGLARFVDHELGSQTTVLAGTTGYMAPESVTTGRASKETDVFSFGVVALEIACGRKPVEPKFEAHKVSLVEWVWEVYGRGRVCDASDENLDMSFDEKEMECLMVVGLWCAHPDYNSRPTIRQAIQVLNFEAPLPILPPKMPVPTYYAPPMDDCRFSYVTSNVTMDSERDRS